MRLSITLTMFASLNVLLGFAGQWYIVTVVGISTDTDALFAGMVIPMLFYAVITGSLTHVLVPLLTTVDEKNFKQNAWDFFHGVGGLFLLVALLFFFTAKYWVPILVPGFDKHAVELTVDLVQIQVIGMVFTSLTSVLWAVNHALKRFVWVELSAMCSNIIGLIVLYYGLSAFGIAGAAWAFVIKPVFQTLFLLPVLGSYKRFNWRSNSFSIAWQRLKPLLLGASYYKSDIILDRFLLSFAASGSITLFHMTQQIYSAGNTIVSRAMLTPIIPELARNAAANEWHLYRRLFLNRLYLISLISVFCYLFIFFAGKWGLSLVFEYSSFDKESINLLWWMLVVLGGLWFGGLTGQLLSSSFYAAGETIIPTIIGVLGFTVGIVIKISAFYLGGIEGLGIGISIYYMINATLLLLFIMIFTHKKINQTN